MQIDSAIAGADAGARVAEIGWRQTSNYAAAVGDANPVYFDDTLAGGLVAPPMLAAAITWPLTAVLGPKLAEAEGAAIDPAIFKTQVHHTESLIFHRLVRPGDTLSVSGRVAAVLPHRAGTRLVIRFDASDASGAPVFTEYSGAMLRGVECMGGGAEIDAPAIPAPGEADNAPLWEAAIAVDALAPYRYDAGSDIHFPIHTSPGFARSVGLPGIIHHGTGTLALAARELVDREAGGDPARLKALSCRFSGMVRPGEEIAVRLLARDDDVDDAGRRALYFEVTTADGGRAIDRGHALIE
jgi:acyl dehydratase